MSAGSEIAELWADTVQPDDFERFRKAREVNEKLANGMSISLYVHYVLGSVKVDLSWWTTINEHLAVWCMLMLQSLCIPPSLPHR